MLKIIFVFLMIASCINNVAQVDVISGQAEFEMAEDLFKAKKPKR